jgi:DNA-binding MarR family transcriptional regulator
MDRAKPIGYWLQHLHNLLETQFDLTLADLGVQRRHWQTLNTISLARTHQKELGESLAPFWTGEGPDLTSVLTDLTERGWIEQHDGVIDLTLAGREAHGHIADRVGRTRAVVTEGLTGDQYAETVRVLSVMSSNVERAISSLR